MWRAAFLFLVASLSSSLATPNLKPLSNEMVNYINKRNTTWTVSFFFLLNSPVLTFISNCILILLKAGHNFHNIDYSYIQKLCGTLLKGPKLPIM